jgi:hypothetical protein
MGKVVHVQQDVLRDIYQELRELRRQLRRLQARDVTFNVQVPTGDTYFLTPGDGSNWIDSSDGSAVLVKHHGGASIAAVIMRRKRRRSE